MQTSHLRNQIILSLACIAALPAVANESDAFGSQLVRSISETRLPFTGGDSELNVDFFPKIGDLLDEPYIRAPIEVEYGFTNTTEGIIGYMPFLENPFHSDPVNSDGYFTFGLKQRIHAPRQDRLAIAVGFDARIPLEKIPSDWVRDNYNTYSPYLTAAYELDRNREWTLFTNIRYDMLDKEHHQLDQDPTEPIDSLTYITTGFLHHPPGDLRYGLRFLYVTEELLGDDHDGLKVIPSITWYPAEDTPVFRSIAGHFELSLDLEWAVSKIPDQADESDLGVSLGIRWNLTRTINPAKEDLMP